MNVGWVKERNPTNPGDINAIAKHSRDRQLTVII